MEDNQEVVTAAPTEAAPEQKPPVQQTKTFHLPKKKKVGIIGCAESKTMAPFNDHAEWEFWGVNNLNLTLKGPWSRWFELHVFDYDGIKYTRRGQADFRGQPVKQYLESLQAMNIPVYMQRPWDVIPNAVPFPLDLILKTFPRKYFTNTISWMIALALLEGFEEIGIWGVDMAVSSPLRQQNEYSHQRPSCEYFIGIAEGKGIKVHLPDQCDLLKTRFLYCFQDVQETAFNKKLIDMKQSMQKRLNEADNKERISNKQKEQYIGAISAIQEIEKIWGND